MVAKAQIVVPVHQLDRPIRRAIDSVLRCADADVIVVAHGLDADVLSLPDDPRIQVVNVPDGVGFPGVAFNAGVRAATAQWVGIMGSDDWFEVGALESMLSRLDQDSADGVLAPLRHDTKATNDLNPVTWRQKNLRARQDRMFYRTAPLGLYRREILQDARYSFDESTHSGEDAVMSARLWSNQKHLSYYWDDPAYVVGSDAGSRVTTVQRPLREHVPAWETMWAKDTLAFLTAQEKVDLANKMFQVNVLPLLQSRPRPSDWIEDDFEWLSRIVFRMKQVAPGFERSFTRSNRRVCEQILDGDLGGSLAALSEASYLDNRLPASAIHVGHRNGWLAKQVRKEVALRYPRRRHGVKPWVNSEGTSGELQEGN